MTPNDPVYWIVTVVWLVRYVSAIFTAYLVYGVWTEKCNSFMLPLSFIPLPFIAYFMLSGARYMLDLRHRSVETWELFASMDAAGFSIIFIVLTFVLSIILEVIKSRNRRLGVEVSLKSRKIMLITAIVLSVVLVGAVSTITIHEYLLNKNITYTEIMSFTIDDSVTDTQLREYYRLPTQYSSLEYTPPQVINDNRNKWEFEQLFGASLPELDFRKYEYLVFIGRKADWKDGMRTLTDVLDMRMITVYKVNTVIVNLDFR